MPKGYLEVSIILLGMKILDYILRPYYSVYSADIMLRLMAILLHVYGDIALLITVVLLC